MFKVNNRNTRTSCEICSKLTIKTPERRHYRRSGVFIVNFEQVNASWVYALIGVFIELTGCVGLVTRYLMAARNF